MEALRGVQVEGAVLVTTPQVGRQVLTFVIKMTEDTPIRQLQWEMLEGS